MKSTHTQEPFLKTIVRNSSLNGICLLNACCAVLSHSVVSSSLRSHGLWPARLLCPRDSPGKNTGAGCHALLRGSPQFSSVDQSCPTLCNPMNHCMPGLPVHHQLPDHVHPKPMSIESVIPSSHIILSRPLLLLPPILPSIRVFSTESALRIR